jgi:transcriptional regulator with XRE-family HTH domain
MAYTNRRFRDRRKQLGLSQEALADLVGTNQAQISAYENGKNDPTGEVLIALSQALETTVDYLLGLTGNPDRPLRGEFDLDEIEREAVKILRSKRQDERRKAIEVLRVL